MIELRCMRTAIVQWRMAMQEMWRSKRGRVSWIKGCWIDAEHPTNVGSSVSPPNPQPLPNRFRVASWWLCHIRVANPSEFWANESGKRNYKARTKIQEHLAMTLFRRTWNMVEIDRNKRGGKSTKKTPTRANAYQRTQAIKCKIYQSSRCSHRPCRWWL